ncbi:MAG TPA: sulfatase-like hydrolase/transferase [Vicinamibacterales bacterium]|nr:sulfatase-like hydrolase/transferase [Acidobacteriota bacterium]HOC16999.1 sulfatase-like hydrolase/transferase [Vicinamibacterales bacterium]
MPRPEDARPAPPANPSSSPRLWLRAGAVVAVMALAAAGAAWWWAGRRPQETAAGVALGAATGGGRASELNLLVITLDTTRADRIGAYGYAGARTPAIDRLAREGVVFEQAMTDAPLTLPAHCSIFTSRHPPRHGVRDNGGFFLSPRQRTLATELKARGLRTGAVVGAFVLDGKWGLDQGFDFYGDDFELDRPAGRGFSVGEIQRRGADVVDKALPWLEQVKGERFFAWLHFYDPHTPYDAPEPFASRFPGHPYDAEIAYTDAQVARVVEFLERDALLDRTVIVVVGDHGEGLNQHDEGTHGFFIYESTTRVPFIVRAPFERTRGRRVADPVRTVDLMPTALDLLGIPAPEGIDGVSLAPLMTGDRPTLDLEGYAEALYPLHHYGWSDLRAWRSGRYKVIDAPRPELYDLERDPNETANLYAERQALADGMIRRLRERQPEIESDETVARPAPEVDPEARARLAALGYVGSFVATLAGPRSERADPKDKIGVFNLMGEARDLAQQEGGFEKVVALYRKVLDEDPNVVDAWFNLGNVHFRQRRYEDAIGYFKRTLELKPDYDLPVINMANAYRQLGQDEAALAGYEHYLTIDPKNAPVRYQMGEIYLDRGDVAQAEENFRKALEIDPREASARNALGVIAFQRGDLAAAERETRAALAIRPTVRLAHYNLALIAEERQDWQTALAEYRREIELHKNAYRAAFNLGRLHERLGQRADMVAALEQSVQMNARFAEGRIFLAKAFLEDGVRFQEAIDLAREGLALQPRRDVAQLGHYVLADLYNRVGRHADAVREAALGEKLGR